MFFTVSDGMLGIMELSKGGRGWWSVSRCISHDTSFHCWFSAGSATCRKVTDSGHAQDGSSFLTLYLPDLRDYIPNVRFLFGNQTNKQTKKEQIVFTSWHLVKFSVSYKKVQ